MTLLTWLFYLTPNFYPHVFQLPPSARFMIDILTAAGIGFLSDLYTAQEAVWDGTTQGAKQKRLYCQRSDFCATLLVNPALQDPYIPWIELLQDYDHEVRNTKYSKGRMDRLGKESVSQAWGIIAATHLLDGLPNTIFSPPFTIPHRSWQAPWQADINLWGKESPIQAGKTHLLGNCLLHCGRGNLLLRPQSQLIFMILCINRAATRTFDLDQNTDFDEGGIVTRSHFCCVCQYNKDKPEYFRIYLFVSSNSNYYFFINLDM